MTRIFLLGNDQPFLKGQGESRLGSQGMFSARVWLREPFHRMRGISSPRLIRGVCFLPDYSLCQLGILLPRGSWGFQWKTRPLH